MHLLLWFAWISVCTYSLLHIGLQSSVIYDDGIAQGFVVELGGGLVMHDTMIGYVNKLITLVALYFSSEVSTIS